MTMKKTELEKRKGLKIEGQMRQAGVADRYGKGSALPSRREQRELDRAAGLVPFAVKLPSALVGQVQALATERAMGLHELTAELLEKALKK